MTGGLTTRGRSGNGWRANTHLDLFRLGFLALRNAQRQHTILVISLDGFAVHGVGQREAAGEGAIRTFDAQVVLLVHFLLELAFTTDSQNVVLDPNVQLFGLHVRQVGLYNEFVFVFVNVDSRSPRGQVLLLG